MSSRNELVQIAEQECLNVGASYEVDEHGKHIKFRVFGLRGNRLVTISKSPSCPFVGKKVRRNVRHALREVGYAPV